MSKHSNPKERKIGFLFLTTIFNLQIKRLILSYEMGEGKFNGAVSKSRDRRLAVALLSTSLGTRVGAHLKISVAWFDRVIYFQYSPVEIPSIVHLL